MKEVVVVNKSETTEIHVYDAIGKDKWFGGGISAKSFVDAVKGVKTKSLDMRINSPGGEVFEVYAMLAAIDGYKGTVTAYVDGVAASAASVLAMGANRIVMAEGSFMMIHDPIMGAVGGVEEMLRAADLLEKAKTNIVKSYERHSKIGAQKIGEMMTAESWMTAEETVKNGFAHEVSKSSRVSNFADLSKFNYRNVPELKIYRDPEAVKATEERKTRLVSLLKEVA